MALLPWATMDWNSNGCIPHGVIWELGTWCMVCLRLFGGHKQQLPTFSAMAELLQRDLGMSILSDSHSKGQSKWWCFLPCQSSSSVASALPGSDQGYEPEIFMPGMVPGEGSHSILQMTVFSVWVCWVLSCKNWNNSSNWRQST